MTVDSAPRLTILSQGERRVITCDEGLSLRDILDATDTRVRSGCNGSGACGLCRVRIEAGRAGEPRGNELIMLTPEELRDNVRLACQVIPEADLTVTIVNPAPRSEWRRLVPAPGQLPGLASPPTRFAGAPPAKPDRASPSKKGRTAAGAHCPSAYQVGLASPPTRFAGAPPAKPDRASPSKVASLQLPGLASPLDGPSCDEGFYGVAVDLGTTNISMSLWDLGAVARLSSVVGPNRQMCHGSDVMTRLISACSSPVRAREMSRLAARSIEAGILDMCGKEGHDFRKIRRISIVGNTAMLALLVGKNGDLLLKPEHWTAAIDCLPEDGQRWFENGLMRDDVSFEVVQPFGGFVGSDLLAAIVATGLTEADAPGALIDFGTNSEIVLWDGRKLWVTSAAGGPAFEGWGIRCGMPAEFGAIYRVDEIPEDPLPSVCVVGGTEPRGICGSGIVDLMANLVRAGRLSKLGKLTECLQKSGFIVARGASDIVLHNRDVDVFQRAKAAIGAGVKVLSRLSRIDMDGLRRMCVCGSFGRFLNVDNAQAIGLLPSILPERVEVWGSAALAGCESFLLSPDNQRDHRESLTGTATLVNLSRIPEFDECFLESLYLQPFETGPES